MRERLLRALPSCALAVLLAVSSGAMACAEETAPVQSPSTAATATVASAADSLDSLEWLLGEWTALTDNAVVLVSTHWCDGGAFIEREIIVRPTDQPEIGGTQRIGWDPIKKTIKSWNFDSTGGTGEGYWRRDGDSWIVESNEVLADGQTSSTTSKLTPKGADRILWEVERANVEGASLPKLKIEFVRANDE